MCGDELTLSCGFDALLLSCAMVVVGCAVVMSWTQQQSEFQH